MVWGTLRREKVLSKEVAIQISRYLGECATAKHTYMEINYVNADHVHALIDLPTGLCVEEAAQLFKGSSSHWINAGHLLNGKFAWGRGYGAFSVSESSVVRVVRYIAEKEQHLRDRSFADELKEFVERHGLAWRDEKPLKRLCHETGESHRAKARC